jgi:hypothetical protein
MVELLTSWACDCDKPKAEPVAQANGIDFGFKDSSVISTWRRDSNGELRLVPVRELSDKQLDAEIDRRIDSIFIDYADIQHRLDLIRALSTPKSADAWCEDYRLTHGFSDEHYGWEAGVLQRGMAIHREVEKVVAVGGPPLVEVTKLLEPSRQLDISYRVTVPVAVGNIPSRVDQPVGDRPGLKPRGAFADYLKKKK